MMLYTGQCAYTCTCGTVALSKAHADPDRTLIAIPDSNHSDLYLEDRDLTSCALMVVVVAYPSPRP